MDSVFNLIPSFLLVVLIGGILLKSVFSRDKSLLFAPIVYISLCFVYYVLLPYFNRANLYGVDLSEGVSFLLWGAMVNYVAILFAFHYSHPSSYFKKTNVVLTQKNILSIAVTLFLFAFICNGLFNGFGLSFISASDTIDFDPDASYNHPEMYLTSLVSLFPASACLIWMSGKKRWLFTLILVVAIFVYLISGFRFRLVLLLIPLFVVIHLYPSPKKVKWVIWIPIVVCFYLLMGIIESSRTYGRGLDVDKLTEIEKTGVEEAKENESVYTFSAATMVAYSDSRIYFEPLFTAIMMPIPRAIFPAKPQGKYLRDANIKVFGSINHGAAFLNFTEAYIAFGWVGIIINGLFIGWLCKIFWSNYTRNKKSIGAILLLAIFDGFTYVLISRGYMAQALTNYIYYIPMFYWLAIFLAKRFKSNTKVNC